MTYFKAFAGTLVTFLIVDLAWITFFVRPYYQKTVGHLLRESPDLAASAVFYLAYVGGIVYFAIVPALAAGSLRVAVLNGAVLGGIAYATYSVTNYAVFEGWTTGLMLSDVAWGIFLTAVCAAGGYFAARL
ncbi:MAG: DUF2177 family protein [Pseudomonadota bacterium]